MLREQTCEVVRWANRKRAPPGRGSVMTSVGWEHDIEILNSLIETTLDSVAGYQEAAREATNPRYRNLFQRRAAERRHVASDLQRQVRALGGTPEGNGSVLTAEHRVFLTLSENLAKGDDYIFGEVERGEDYLTNKYEEAIDDDDLSVNIRTAVVRAYASVKSGHDQMRDLKRSMRLAIRP
jgi:uncharacterized protein (TIGR02284 family)